MKQPSAQCDLRGVKVLGGLDRGYGLSSTGLAEYGGSDEAHQEDHPGPGHATTGLAKKLGNGGNRRFVPAFSSMLECSLESGPLKRKLEPARGGNCAACIGSRRRCGHTRSDQH